MPVKIAAEYDPNEVVTIDRYDPGNNLVQTFQGTTNPKGQFEITLDSWTTNTPGFWTYKLKGKTTGKELVLYVWLDPPVTQPTMIISPTTVNKTQVVEILVVGFKPSEEVYFAYKSPTGEVISYNRRYNFYYKTGTGGGILGGGGYSENYPFNIIGIWTFGVYAKDTTNGTRSVTGEYTITE
jgi:hypothetical protein